MTALLDELRRDPFVIQWKEKVIATRPNTEVQSPLDVMGERNMWALMLLDPTIGIDFGDLVDSDREDEARESLADAVFRQSVPFWWTRDVTHTIRGLPLPKHIVGRQKLPAPMMWISYEAAHTSDKFSRDALLLTERPDGLEILMFGGNNDGELMVKGELMRPDYRYPDDVPPDTVGAQVLRFLAFIHSPYTELRKAQVSRPDRRRLVKAGYSHEPEVHVVKLRAAVADAVAAERSITGSKHWQHRWWVRGHFRAQWYAKEQAHRVVWIAPYVKGPDEKPFKSAVYAVVR